MGRGRVRNSSWDSPHVLYPVVASLWALSALAATGFGLAWILENPVEPGPEMIVAGVLSLVLGLAGLIIHAGFASRTERPLWSPLFAFGSMLAGGGLGGLLGLILPDGAGLWWPWIVALVLGLAMLCYDPKRPQRRHHVVVLGRQT